MILSSTLLPILTILLSIPNTLAHPTTDDLSLSFQPRSNPGDSKSNPIKGEIEIRGEDALTYDVDCWAMLCKGKSAVMQKVDTDAADVNRQVEAGSAANKQPFKDPTKYGMKASPATNSWGNNKGWVSAEEFPFASTKEGGKDAILVGVTINSQDEQKRSLRSFYQKNKVKSYDSKNKKSNGSWFEITGFKVKSGKNAKVGPYCQAFTDKKPGNVCNANTKVTGAWGFDVAEYAYVYNHSTKKFDYVGK
ncbi:hypothetical protein AnigIFM59636_010739 [Aspergillus niger]|uniref:Deoxyribonuclease NucA/NucB domain-containing protein n=1 Tax=Aspergillus phoenicis ATCC 13157 TaxID=1353007 RepID=A0A370PVG4_ASPPH|nr:hypothetical protein CBS147346_1196 [Aspergillus niger]RDK46193.1 hypothetical protein M752DRAFT_262528 [Aspergillus phoenicis ATCC 13157]GKZ96487.1 hypothetical protein AnigIFM59636_010739 [Aspergillus niger]GLA23188.1 hypothetical protein AnigIFM63326_006818 [Aspergillus niger]